MGDEMNELGRDITSIFMAIIGVAILALILSPRSQTTSVAGAIFSGLAQDLTAAGNAGNGSGISYAPMSYSSNL
jgi:hypothetical protein